MDLGYILDNGRHFSLFLVGIVLFIVSVLGIISYADHRPEIVPGITCLSIILALIVFLLVQANVKAEKKLNKELFKYIRVVSQNVTEAFRKKLHSAEIGEHMPMAMEYIEKLEARNKHLEERRDQLKAKLAKYTKVHIEEEKSITIV